MKGNTLDEKLRLLLEARSKGVLLLAFCALTFAPFIISSSAMTLRLSASFILLVSATVCNAVFEFTSTALTFAPFSMKRVTSSSRPKCQKTEKNYKHSSSNHVIQNHKSPNLAASDNRGSPLLTSLTFASLSTNSLACWNENKNQWRTNWGEKIGNEFYDFTIDELPLVWAKMNIRFSFIANIHQNKMSKFTMKNYLNVWHRQVETIYFRLKYWHLPPYLTTVSQFLRYILCGNNRSFTCM